MTPQEGEGATQAPEPISRQIEAVLDVLAGKKMCRYCGCCEVGQFMSYNCDACVSHVSPPYHDGALRPTDYDKMEPVHWTSLKPVEAARFMTTERDLSLIKLWDQTRSSYFRTLAQKKSGALNPLWVLPVKTSTISTSHSPGSPGAGTSA